MVARLRATTNYVIIVDSLKRISFPGRATTCPCRLDAHSLSGASGVLAYTDGSAGFSASNLADAHLAHGSIILCSLRPLESLFRLGMVLSK